MRPKDVIEASKYRAVRTNDPSFGKMPSPEELRAAYARIREMSDYAREHGDSCMFLTGWPEEDALDDA